jgi:RHS repeat-associated protein
MDLNTGLTQALSDGTSHYIYGLSRIAQVNTVTEYFLGDALGSVRQLVNSSGEITYSRAYDPYGVVTSTLGDSQTSYGFTGESYGDSTQLTYLRSRYYSGSTGRFISRDTWSGNANMPMSFNRWAYVNGNPINYIDPTGMKPGDSNYCLYLSGRDWQYCNNIVRGINPDQPMTVADYIDFDQLGSCYNPPLQDVFPHVVYTQPTGTWKEYGWWWHYLLERTPGPWNNFGKGHIKFSDVIAFALAAELSTSIDTYPKIVGYAAGAFYTKGSGEGYYRMIGSRQSVYMRVNTALYGSPLGGTYDFNNNVKYFNEINDIANNARRLSARGEDILKGTNLKPEEKLAYEWGNPTLSSPQKLLNALKSFDNMGSRPGQVLWFSNQWYERFPTTNVNGTIVYRLAFVVTEEQINELCGKASCVAP